MRLVSDLDSLVNLPSHSPYIFIICANSSSILECAVPVCLNFQRHELQREAFNRLLEEQERAREEKLREAFRSSAAVPVAQPGTVTTTTTTTSNGPPLPPPPPPPAPLPPPASSAPIIPSEPTGKVYFYITLSLVSIILVSLFCCCFFACRKRLGQIGDCFRCQRCALFVHGVLSAHEDVSECVAAAATQTSSTANLLELNFMDEEVTARRQLEILEQKLSSTDTSTILKGRFSKSIKSVSDLLTALGSVDPPPNPPIAAATASAAVTPATTATATAADAVAAATNIMTAEPVPTSIAPSTSSTATSTTTLTPSLDATSLGE